MSELLIVVFGAEGAALVSVDFNVYFFDDLFEDLVVNVGKVLVKFLETNIIVILLEESDNVCLRSSLNEVLVLSALRIVHFKFWFLLAHYVELTQFSHYNLGVLVLVPVHHAEEIVARWLMVKSRAVIHVVLHYSQAFVELGVYLAEERDFFTFFLEDLDSMGSHMAGALVITSS